MAKKKAKKKVHAKKEEVFFVGIKDPIGLRRSVLEASKDVVQSLQRFEKFTVARRKKRESVEQLKETVKETVRLIAKLRKNLPKGGLRMAPVHKPKPVPKPKPVKHKKAHKAAVPSIKKQLKPKDLGELEKLESELGDIESKLGSLS
jgi:hypothetical protein